MEDICLCEVDAFDPARFKRDAKTLKHPRCEIEGVHGPRKAIPAQ
jgi:hypothetical protein